MGYRQLLDEMFRESVLKKDASKFEKYYAPDFVCFTNGKTMEYPEYLAFHEKVYTTPIQYEVRIEDETVVEDASGVGCRVFITTTMPGEKPRELELVIVAKFVGEKLHRLWEVCWPDWTQQKELQPT